jgi:hypothetical protein
MKSVWSLLLVISAFPFFMSTSSFRGHALPSFQVIFGLPNCVWLFVTVTNTWKKQCKRRKFILPHGFGDFGPWLTGSMFLILRWSKTSWQKGEVEQSCSPNDGWVAKRTMPMLIGFPLHLLLLHPVPQLIGWYCPHSGKVFPLSYSSLKMFSQLH